MELTTAVNYKVEEAHDFLLDILNLLDIEGMMCPCNLARKVGINEKNIYLPVSELLSHGLVEITDGDLVVKDKPSHEVYELKIPEFDIKGLYQVSDFMNLAKAVPSILDRTRLWYSFFRSFRNRDDVLFFIFINSAGKSYLQKSPIFPA